MNKVYNRARQHTTVPLKDEFLKLLREDEEFRLAVAGLLGLGAVLDELRRLREDFNRLLEEVKKLREDFNKLREDQGQLGQELVKLREDQNRLREDQNQLRQELVKLREDFNGFVKVELDRWVENEKRWEENDKRWNQYIDELKRLREDLNKLREDFNRFVQLEEERWRRANGRFARIELELGASVEAQYTRYVWEDLRDELRARGEVVERRVRNARIDNVDVDLLVVTDKAAYVVEVKLKPTVRDVNRLLAKARVVQERVQRGVVPVLTGSLVGGDVAEYAEGRGVRIYVY